MKLCQQFPRLGHRNQYRPMLGRSHHAGELQALLGVLTIFFYFGVNHYLVSSQAERSPGAQCAGTSPVLFRLSG